MTIHLTPEQERRLRAVLDRGAYKLTGLPDIRLGEFSRSCKRDDDQRRDNRNVKSHRSEPLQRATARMG
jgi:hypothetical protein